MTNKQKEELEFKKLNQREHALLRPDMYIGETKAIQSENVWIKQGDFFEKQTIVYSEGLMRIISEIINNAIDNILRSQEFDIKMKEIKINIDKENGKITIYNDGKNIPVKKNDEGMYIIEMLFGSFLTSSNYNDKEERYTSGKNGVGSSATNTYSTEFEVECLDPNEKLLYKQKWTDNMANKSNPIVEKTKQKIGYTKISFIPDYPRFSLKKMTNGMIKIIEKTIWDCAMIASEYKVKVFYNDNLVNVSNLNDYVKLYYQNELPEEMLYMEIKNMKIMLIANNEWNHVSFVNGIYTCEGGTHVNICVEGFFRPIVDYYNTKNKDNNKITIESVKKYFSLFVISKIDKPNFSSQNKSKLTNSLPKLQVEDKYINKLKKWEFMDKLNALLDTKELKKLDGLQQGKKGFSDLPSFCDSNFSRSNSSKRKDCILVVVEGLSANTYVSKTINTGIFGKKGNDYIGRFPIRGKLMNTRKASPNDMIKNKEINGLIRVLGLKTNVDYTLDENFKKLRYGKIVGLCDADVDGTHINSLLYNFFDTVYPSLLKRGDFFYFMRTPIIVINSNVNKKLQQQKYYFQEEGRKYIENNDVNKSSIHYIKGLARLNEIVKDEMGKRMVSLKIDEKSDVMLENIFGEATTFRKSWLRNAKPQTSFPEIEDYKIEELSVTAFLNNEVIEYSLDSNRRSLPNIYDGLKESQRKIVYSVFLKNLHFTGNDLKVFQLAGYVAEKSSYHHGEMNLTENITGLAQDYVGSNNLPLLYAGGEFGSRLENGKDAGSARYIFTKLEECTRDLFLQEDDDYLENLYEEGEMIEKRWYLPILPLILINGASGIGTGFSTYIPCYNPLDLIAWITNWLELDGNVCEEKNGIKTYFTPELIPWYRGFKGRIEKINSTSYNTYGILTEEKGEYKVTELPIGKNSISITKFRKNLEKMLEDKEIVDFSDNCSSEIVNFTIKPNNTFKITEKSLKLIDSVSINNMHAFAEEKDKIYKYNTVEEILIPYCEKRLQQFEIVRLGTIKTLKYDLMIVTNKIKFIDCVCKNDIILINREEEDVCEELTKKKFDKDDKENFNYLLNIPYRTATKKKLEELKVTKTKIEEGVKYYQNTSDKEMWLKVLQDFEIKYKKWLLRKENEVENVEKKNVEKKVKKVIKKK